MASGRGMHFLVDSMVWLHFLVHRDKMAKLSTHHTSDLGQWESVANWSQTYATSLDIGVWVHGSTVCKHTANAYVLLTLVNNIQLALETKQIKHKT